MYEVGVQPVCLGFWSHFSWALRWWKCVGRTVALIFPPIQSAFRLNRSCLRGGCRRYLLRTHNDGCRHGSLSVCLSGCLRKSERTMRRIHLNRVSILALLFLTGVFWTRMSPACTTAVISGKVTHDGRPILWKNRDTLRAFTLHQVEFLPIKVTGCLWIV